MDAAPTGMVEPMRRSGRIAIGAGAVLLGAVALTLGASGVGVQGPAHQAHPQVAAAVAKRISSLGQGSWASAPPVVLPKSPPREPAITPGPMPVPKGAIPGQGLLSLSSAWQTEVGTTYYQLLAGADRNTSIGVLLVEAEGFSPPGDSDKAYDAPTGVRGPIAIDSVQGPDVVVSGANGSKATFDLTTSQWIVAR